ncbi:hypothetical protein CI238_03288 [Colletotrichum incanum]|uniref:Uncharacterized protein n=1 Tax=Colletotrichum incanum TaxID=1573173 RepID=A0A162P749_COLIC|nr:hypothetical protein CI238_03288 [Colletotrichum incanum]
MDVQTKSRRVLQERIRGPEPAPKQQSLAGLDTGKRWHSGRVLILTGQWEDQGPGRKADARSIVARRVFSMYCTYQPVYVAYRSTARLQEVYIAALVSTYRRM